MINLEKLHEEYLTKKMTRIPCKSNRASSIGYWVPQLEGCLRQGVYERTRWAEKQLPDTRLQSIFEEGKEQEKLVLKVLSDMGVEVFDQQGCGEWEKYNITWHLDGCIRDGNDSIPLEIKSMNPNVFAQIKTLEDFKKKPWTTAYLAQIQVYMLGKNVDRGLFVLKDKSNGTLRQIEVVLDYELAEHCIKACEIINEHVAAGTLPEPITDLDKCADCKFNHICKPERNFGTPLTIADDPEFESKITKYLEIEQTAKDAEEAYQLIRERAMATANSLKAAGTGDGGLNLMVGPYTLTGSLNKKGSFMFKIERN